MIVWPSARAKLVEVIPTLDAFADASVYDGRTTSGDVKPKWITVGDQPSTRTDPNEATAAGSFEQTAGPDGFQSVETGTVLMEIGSDDGDGIMPDLLPLAEALCLWASENQTLDGLLSANGTVAVSVEPYESINSQNGASARLLLTLTYTTLV